MRLSAVVVIIVVSIILLIIPSITSSYTTKDNHNDNFEKIRKKFQSGDHELYYNLSAIPKEYYLKPEFYTTFDDYKKVKEQKGTYGYGAQPSTIAYNVTIFKEGQYVNVYTFVRTSYDVGNFQGIGFDLFDLSSSDGLFETYVNPSDILLQPILLGNPEKQSEWVFIIKMTIVAKKDIPKGEYKFSLIPRMPSPEKQSEFQKITQDFKGRYVNIGPIRPADFFDFLLYVD